MGRRNHIPGDVMMEIVSHLGTPLLYPSDALMPAVNIPRHCTLLSLALACREYYYRLLPFLYEVIYVHLGYEGEDVLARNHSAFSAQLCRNLAAGDKRACMLATYVRTYIISGPMNTNRLLLAAYDALALFPNLRELQLSRIPITDKVLSSTVALSSLRTLRIQDCSVPKHLDDALLKKFSALQVTHLYDNDMCPDGNGPVDGLAARTQAQQFFQHYPMSHVKSLTSRGRTHSHFLNGLAKSHSSMKNLEHAKFNVIASVSDGLTAFLKAVPGLRTLHIEEVQYPVNVVTVSPLPLPNLEYLHAPLPVLRAIAPGSGLKSAGVARENMLTWTPAAIYDEKSQSFWAGYAEALSRSSQPIVVLDVPMSFYGFINFSEYFPSLRSLTIRPMYCNWMLSLWRRGDLGRAFGSFNLYSGPEDIIKLFLETWKFHPDIEELTFLFDNFSLTFPVVHKRARKTVKVGPCEIGLDVLKLLKDKIPSLKSLTFCDRPSTSFGDGSSYQFWL